MIKPNINFVHIKKEKIENETSGILLDVTSDAILSKGTVLQDTTVMRTVGDETISQDFTIGQSVYFQKTKGFDTHIKDEQVVKAEDIIYWE